MIIPLYFHQSKYINKELYLNDFYQIDEQRIVELIKITESVYKQLKRKYIISYVPFSYLRFLIHINFSTESCFIVDSLIFALFKKFSYKFHFAAGDLHTGKGLFGWRDHVFLSISPFSEEEINEFLRDDNNE